MKERRRKRRRRTKQFAAIEALMTIVMAHMMHAIDVLKDWCLYSLYVNVERASEYCQVQRLLYLTTSLFCYALCSRFAVHVVHTIKLYFFLTWVMFTHSAALNWHVQFMIDSCACDFINHIKSIVDVMDDYLCLWLFIFSSWI